MQENLSGVLAPSIYDLALTEIGDGVGLGLGLGLGIEEAITIGGMGVGEGALISEASLAVFRKWLFNVLQRKGCRFYLAMAASIGLTAVGTTWIYKTACYLLTSRSFSSFFVARKPALSLTQTENNQVHVDPEEQQLINTTPEEISKLSKKERQEAAKKLKEYGNIIFRLRKYQEAYEIYSKALDYHQDEVFFFNRAACSQLLGNYFLMLDDCNKALNLHRYYVNALIRRGFAYEAMGQLNIAAQDFATAGLFSNFSDKTALKCLTKSTTTIAENQAPELFRNRDIPFPRSFYIQQFLECFEPSEEEQEAIKDNSRKLNKGDKLYKQAIKNIQEQHYETAYEKVEQSISNGKPTGTRYLAQAYNLRGTLHFLNLRLPEAIDDFCKSIHLKSNYVQSYVKLALAYLDLNKLDTALEIIVNASFIRPTLSDIYFCWGQIKFRMHDYSEAIIQYLKVIASRSETPSYIYVSLALCQLKLGFVEQAKASFNEAIEKYKDDVHLLNCYIQALMEHNEYDQVIQQLDTCLKLEPINASTLANQAWLYIEYYEDYAKALASSAKALKFDPQNSRALFAMAHVYMTNRQELKAMDMLQKFIKTTRSYPQFVDALAHKEALLARLGALKNHPEVLPLLDDQYRQQLLNHQNNNQHHYSSFEK